MLMINNHGFKRSYVYGGSGIFDTITSVLTKSAAASAAKNLAKSAAKSLASKAASELASRAAKSIVPKVTSIARAASPKVASIARPVAPKVTAQAKAIAQKMLLTPKSQDIINTDADLNALIAGSAIKIQDYVKTI